MADLDTIARIQIEATTDGVEQSTAQLDQLTAAQDRLATQSNITSATTDTSAAKQLSAETAYQRLATRIDSTYASSQAYAKGQGVLSAALNQGIIDSATYETRLGQLGAKFGVVNEAVAESPGIFRSLTDALGLTTPALGATAVASEAAGVAHGHHSSAAKELRETLHTVDPALKSVGASLAGVSQFTGAARGGIELLTVALGIAFVAAAANAAEQINVTKQRLSELFDSSKVGTSAFEGLEKQADSLGISVSGLVKPYETLIQLVGQLQQKEVGSGTVNPARTAGVSQDVIDSITNFMKADNLSSAEIDKDTQAIIASMASRSVSVKQLHADLTTTTEKVQALDSQGFQKIIDSSPLLALALAKAFNYSDIDTFKLHLDETPVSTQSVITALSKLPAASKAAFDASRANGKTFQDQIGALGVAWDHLLVTVGNIGALSGLTTAINAFAAGWAFIFGGQLPELASKGFDLVSAAIQSWVSQAIAYFAPWVASVKAMWTDWTTWASDKLAALRDTISAWVAPVAGFFTTLGTGIKLEWTDATTWASDKLAALKSTISGWITPVIDLFNSIGDAIKNGWGAALDYIGSKLSWLTGLVSTVGSLIGKLAPDMSGFSNLTSGNANYAPAGGLPPLTIADIQAAVNGSDVTQSTSATAQNTEDTAQGVVSAVDAIRINHAALTGISDAIGRTNEDINNELATASTANQSGHAKTASAVAAAANQISTGLSNSTADIAAALSTDFGDLTAAMDQTSVAKAGQSIAVGSAPVYQTPAGPYIGGSYGGNAGGVGAPYPIIYNNNPANKGLPGYEGGGGTGNPNTMVDANGNVVPNTAAATATAAATTAVTALTTALNTLTTAAAATASALSPLYQSTSGWSGLGLGAASQVLPNPYSTVGVPGPSYQAPGTSISGAANSNLTAPSAPPTTTTAPLTTAPAVVPAGGVPPGLIDTGYINSQGQHVYINSAGQVVNGGGTATPPFTDPYAPFAVQPGLTPAPVGGVSSGGAGLYGGMSFVAAEGIDFDVPGSAGAGDSVHLDAWVKPSEHVSVSNPSNDNGRPLPQVAPQAGPTYFVTNVNTNDKRSFINSEAQIAAQMARAVYAATARR